MLKVVTVEDFYNKCKQLGIEKYEINIQFRDDGGDYYGKTNELYFKINDSTKSITI